MSEHINKIDSIRFTSIAIFLYHPYKKAVQQQYHKNKNYCNHKNRLPTGFYSPVRQSALMLISDQ